MRTANAVEWRFSLILGRWSIEWTRFLGLTFQRTDFFCLAFAIERGLDAEGEQA